MGGPRLYKLRAFSSWMSRYTPYVVISAAVLAFFVPAAFSWVTGYTQTAILGFIIPVGICFGCNVLALALIVGGVISAVHDNLLAGSMALVFITFGVVFCHNL